MTMPTKESQQREYKHLLQIGEPMEIWTPDGCYKAPGHIDKNKMPDSLTLPQVIIEAAKRNPRQRIMTSGEWYQIREKLQETTPDVEKIMVSGSYERTSTILDFDHGKKNKKDKYFDGLLIQIPKVDDEGNLSVDEKGILKARHLWEMALPLKSDHVNNMPPELDMFIDTIYGMKGVRKELPNYAYISITPEGLRNLLRGDWSWPDHESRRVDVSGLWEPLNPDEDVSARAAVD